MEVLARLCDWFLIFQAVLSDCFVRRPCSENGSVGPEMDVGWPDVIQALAMSPGIAVGEEGRNVTFEITR